MPNGAPPARRSFGRTLRRFLMLVALGGLVLFALYTFAAWKFSYSEGERAGYVQKFSRKGWICKTWEGELAMANLPGAMPQIFEFTVLGDQVAEDLNRHLGERVKIHYQQHVGLPSTCFGDTSYFVDRVEKVED